MVIHLTNLLGIQGRCYTIFRILRLKQAQMHYSLKVKVTPAMKVGNKNGLYAIGLMLFGLSLFSYFAAFLIGGSSPFIVAWRIVLWILIAAFPLPLFIAVFFDGRLSYLVKSVLILLILFTAICSVLVLPFAVTTESPPSPRLIAVTLLGLFSCWCAFFISINEGENWK